MRMHRHFHEATRIVVPCKRVQQCCATLRRSRNNGNVGTCCAKSLTGFKLFATSANIVVVPCKRMRHVRPNNLRVVGQHCCVRLHGPKSLTGFKLYATSANIVVVPCKRTRMRVVGQHCCVRLHGP